MRRGFLSLRARAWAYLVPIHLAAFLGLYAASYSMLRSEIVAGASEIARSIVEHEIDELGIIVTDPESGEPSHLLEELIGVHASMGLGLFRGDGEWISGAPSAAASDRAELRESIERGTPEHVQVNTQRGETWLRLVRRLEAEPRCQSCHRPGELLGVMSLNLDLTPQIEAAKSRLRRNLTVLLVGWLVVVSGVTLITNRSVRRSVDRLEADLAAAEKGENPPAASALALDPISASLHQSLHRFLRRARRRQERVASRLEHTDQLASLGRLSAGLAHEIKNPLAGIYSALEILREDVRDRRSKKICGDVLQELNRVNQILKLLLESARPSPACLVETDLPELFEEIAQLLAPGLRRDGITLETEIAPAVTRAVLDRAKIRQVLLNLVTNAADVTEGGGRIVLKAASLPEQDGIVLAVEDDGPGIAEEDQQRIFEPFFTTKFDGTGLGLAIARSLVEQHGGTLEVESSPAGGATFFILLPSGAQEAAGTRRPRTGGRVSASWP